MKRKPISDNLRQFLKNAAELIEIVALEIGAHGLDQQAHRLRNVAGILRDRETD